MAKSSFLLLKPSPVLLKSKVSRRTSRSGCLKFHFPWVIRSQFCCLTAIVIANLPETKICGPCCPLQPSRLAPRPGKSLHPGGVLQAASWNATKKRVIFSTKKSNIGEGIENTDLHSQKLMQTKNTAHAEDTFFGRIGNCQFWGGTPRVYGL